MERWEEELAAQLRDASEGPDANGDEAAAAGSQDEPLLTAFYDIVRRTGRSIARVAEAAGLQPHAVEEKARGRFRWSLQGRHLRLRLDPEAQKFFISLESDAGLAMSELWVEDGTLLTDANGAGAADREALVREHVTQLFRGAPAAPTGE